jgi:hypothetical protein
MSPAPQPTSSTDRPESGLTEDLSPPQCASIQSRTKRSRTGLSLWSMADEPAGSHQSAAIRPKCKASKGLIVVPVMRPSFPDAELNTSAKWHWMFSQPPESTLCAQSPGMTPHRGESYFWPMIAKIPNRLFLGHPRGPEGHPDTRPSNRNRFGCTDDGPTSLPRARNSCLHSTPCLTGPRCGAASQLRHNREDHGAYRDEIWRHVNGRHGENP